MDWLRKYFSGSTVFLLVAFFAWFPITDTDIWWHLASARAMLLQGGFLQADPFSFTPSVSPWLNLHWLYQLLVYFVHHFTGLYGLVFLKALFFGAAFSLNFLVITERRHTLFRVAIFGVFAFQVRFLMLDRPVMLTLLFIAVFLFSLERFRHDGRIKWLALLLMIQVVWINSQGLSAIGLAIAGCYLIEALFEKRKEWRKLLGWFSLLLVCGLLNPYGWKGLILPLRLFHRILPAQANAYSMNISENVPLIHLPPGDVHFALTAVLMLVLLSFGFWLNRRILRLSHLLLSFSFAFLAFLALRNVLLFVFIGLFVLNHLVSTLPEEPKRRWIFIRNSSWVFLALLIGLQARMLYDCRGLRGLSPFRIPDLKLIEFLKTHPIQGNCFNGDRYGGYLSWMLYPPKKNFIDGRFTIKPVEVFDEYFRALDYPQSFPGLVEKYGITHVLLPISVFERYFPLTHYLKESPVWQLVYMDGSSVLFVKKESASGLPEINTKNIEQIEQVKIEISKQWEKNTRVRDEAISCLDRFFADP